MTDADRTELFDVLRELRRRHPEWRLGQLVLNVAEWADQNPWDIDDEQFLAVAKEHLRALSFENASAHT